jgi:hypothetical protein
MGTLARVTITLSEATVQAIDAVTDNRSRFIQNALERELRRRRRAELRRSLAEPHPDAALVKEEDVAAWAERLPVEDGDGLVNPAQATSIRWVAGQGWRTPAKPTPKTR